MCSCQCGPACAESPGAGRGRAGSPGALSGHQPPGGPEPFLAEVQLCFGGDLALTSRGKSMYICAFIRLSGNRSKPFLRYTPVCVENRRINRPLPGRMHLGTTAGSADSFRGAPASRRWGTCWILSVCLPGRLCLWLRAGPSCVAQ